MSNTVQNCTVSELNEKIKSGEPVQIIDVREEHEYQTVRLQDTVLLPLSTFHTDFNKVDKSKPAYMLCGVGKRATVAAEHLLANGYSEVIVIDGGIKDWINSGFEVKTSS